MRSVCVRSLLSAVRSPVVKHACTSVQKPLFVFKEGYANLKKCIQHSINLNIDIKKANRSQWIAFLSYI